VIVIDLHIRPDQEQRLRETRDIPPEGDIRPRVVHDLGQLIAGEGALDDVWTSRVRGRPEEA
jgi:hypothetical protein